MIGTDTSQQKPDKYIFIFHRLTVVCRFLKKEMGGGGGGGGGLTPKMHSECTTEAE